MNRREKRQAKRQERKKEHHHWAFIRKLNLTTMGITSAISLLLAAVFGLMLLYIILFSTKHISQENVDYAAHDINKQLLDFESYVQFCGNEITNRALTNNPAGKEEKIRNLLEAFLYDKQEAAGCALALNPAWEGQEEPYMRYAFRASGGRVISIALDTPEKYDYTAMEWFTEPVKSGKPFWSPPYYDLGAGNILMCTYARPIYERGDTTGKIPVAVLTIDIALDRLARMTDAAKYENKGSVYLTTSQNIVLVHPDKDALMKPWDKPVGKGQLELSAPIAATGWTLTYIMQRSERLGPFYLFVGFILFVLIQVLLIVNVVMRRSIRRIALPEMEKQARMDTELDMAARIQRSMLPHSTHPFALDTDVDVRAFMRPAKVVGGDLYQFYLAGRRLFFMVGDVSGKGVAAAVVMSMISERFLSIAPAASNPEEIVENINRRVAQDNEMGMFATLLIGMLDLDNGECTLCNAGHNPPVVLPVEGKPYLLELEKNLPAGVMADMVYKTDSLRFTDGMRILLYTDGITEAENAALELFGEKRLLEAVSDILPYHTFMPLDNLDESVKTFVAGHEQSDDMTALCVQYTPVSPVINLLPKINQLQYLTMFLEKLDLPAPVSMKVNLALEEAFVNEVNYSGCTHIQLAAHKFTDESGKEVLRLTLTDDGKAFDPLSVSKKKPDTAEELNPKGGLGIIMLKELSDRIAYSRILNKNILTIEKIIQHGNKD